MREILIENVNHVNIAKLGCSGIAKKHSIPIAIGVSIRDFIRFEILYSNLHSSLYPLESSIRVSY